MNSVGLGNDGIARGVESARAGPVLVTSDTMLPRTSLINLLLHTLTALADREAPSPTASKDFANYRLPLLLSCGLDYEP